MTAILTKKAPARETCNTFNLPTGGAIRRELVKVFKQQRRAILGYIAEFKSWDGLEFKTGMPPSWPQWDQFKLGALAVSQRMAPLLEVIWDDAGQAFTSRVGLDPDTWDVSNPQTQAAIDQAALEFCTATNETTSLALADALDETRKAIADGTVSVGQSMDELTKAVNEIFDNAETWRARRIATSEASRALHGAQELAAKESGVVTGWKWLASGDACPICQRIARSCQFVQLDQPFAVIGNNPTYSTIKYPPAHPGCQCSMVEVLDIDEQPDWADTLIQPKPEEEDYPPGEAPEGVKAWLKPRPFPRPVIRRRVFSDS